MEAYQKSKNPAIVVVHPRRDLDQVLTSAKSRGYDLIIVPREGEDRLWNNTDAAVEPYYKLAKPSNFSNFLIEVIRRYRADGIIGVYEASLIDVARAARDTGLPTLRVETVERLRTKAVVRKVLSEAGLPSPGYVTGYPDRQLEQTACRLRLPVVVKPANGFSSAGVEKIEDFADLSPAISRSLGSLDGIGVEAAQVVVEEYIDGAEYVAESMTFAGKTRVLTVGYKGNPKGPFFEESVYQVPAGLDKNIEADITEVVEKAHTALGIDFGPTHTELRLGPTGEPMILEIGSRIGGSGISHIVVQGATGIDFFGDVLDAAIGRKPTDLSKFSPGPVPCLRAAGNYIVPCSGSGTIAEIAGLEQIKTRDGVKLVVQMLFPGDTVMPYPEFSGYPVFVLSVHESYDQLLALHKDLAETIKIRYE